MEIRQVRWKNYRRIPDGKIDVRKHVVLVGPNDTGKSSLLRALHMCLGMAHSQLSAAISARDFTDQSQPLILEVTLDGIGDEDRAAFPDEITIGATETLLITVEASVDPTDPDQVAVRRLFPDSGHNRGPSRDQLQAIGFEFVPAARSLARELGSAAGGAVRSLLTGLDLSADGAAFQAAADQYRTALDSSTALGNFRKDLADALSGALPVPVAETDVRVVSDAEALDDPLTGVSITIAEAGQPVPLAEQSDGIRALSVLTLLSMSHRAAKIVALDEPESHLHPTAQRAISRSLSSDVGQRVIATHSAGVVGEMRPVDVVAIRADRVVHQLPPGAPIASFESTVRHWAHALIEPLTARRVALLEGVSDRILVERVAQLTGVNLNRAGVSLFDIGGAGLFSVAYPVFGPGGFNVSMVGMLDEDARGDWAGELGIKASDLESAGYVVCDPDLEAAYIDSLGFDVVLQLLLESPVVKERSVLDVCKVATVSDVTRDLLWSYCRSSSKKVACATAVAAGLDPAQAALITPIVQLLTLATA